MQQQYNINEGVKQVNFQELKLIILGLKSILQPCQIDQNSAKYITENIFKCISSYKKKKPQVGNKKATNTMEDKFYINLDKGILKNIIFHFYRNTFNERYMDQMSSLEFKGIIQQKQIPELLKRIFQEAKQFLKSMPQFFVQNYCDFFKAVNDLRSENFELAKDKIKQLLIGGIQTSILVNKESIYSKIMYGETLYNCIFVNIFPVLNYIDIRIRQTQFKDKNVIMMYFCLIIMRELGHYILRKSDMVKEGDLSFDQNCSNCQSLQKTVIQYKQLHKSNKQLFKTVLAEKNAKQSKLQTLIKGMLQYLKPLYQQYENKIKNNLARQLWKNIKSQLREKINKGEQEFIEGLKHFFRYISSKPQKKQFDQLIDQKRIIVRMWLKIIQEQKLDNKKEQEESETITFKFLKISPIKKLNDYKIFEEQFFTVMQQEWNNQQFLTEMVAFKEQEACQDIQKLAGSVKIQQKQQQIKIEQYQKKFELLIKQNPYNKVVQKIDQMKQQQLSKVKSIIINGQKQFFVYSKLYQYILLIQKILRLENQWENFPIFFKELYVSSVGSRVQSGFIIENLFFPYIQETHKIFNKDFEYFKKAMKNKSQIILEKVGKKSDEPKQQSSFIKTQRSKDDTPCIDMAYGRCNLVALHCGKKKYWQYKQENGLI